jgi:signal transduction histidine kinase/CheY-like chemotaxis protein
VRISIEDRSSRHLGFALAIAIVMTVGTLDVLYTGKAAIQRQGLVENIALEIELQLAKAHFHFEQIIAGKHEGNVDLVWRYLDDADLRLRTQLEDARRAADSFIAPGSLRLWDVIQETQNKLVDFRKAISVRWENGESTQIGPELERRHHTAFHEVMRAADGIKGCARASVLAEMRTQQELQTCMIVGALLMCVFVGRILRRSLTQRDLANDQLRKAKEAAEVASRSKSEFLANMSHEIRTPMTAILGFAEILRVEGNLEQAPPGRVEAIDTIVRNGEYLRELIDGILDLSKIESGKLEVERIPCVPCELVSDVVRLMKVRAAAKGLSLESRCEGPLPKQIETDPTRLRQILVNLLGNAIKFTEVGRVLLVVGMAAPNGDDPKLEFEVVDTGIGMTKEQADRVFEPFAQADNSTTRKYGGTGLGLAISKRLTEMLGGEISFESSLGKGTVFRVTVATGPLDELELLANPAEEQLAGEHPGSLETRASLPAGCRLPLVEDGPDNQRLFSLLLRKAGAEVTLAENGQRAIDLVHAASDTGEPFDVILMDMQMPVLDGYEATRRLRAEGYARPIIALTAHAMGTDRTRCLEAGCDDYTTKPIDRTKFLEIVAKYAAHRNRLPEPTPAEWNS